MASFQNLKSNQIFFDISWDLLYVAVNTFQPIHIVAFMLCVPPHGWLWVGLKPENV